jgi:hypothetical protein
MLALNPYQVDLIRTYFKTRPVMRAWIFGSHARGEANADSDIDILVELDYDSKIGWEFITMQHELQKALGKKVDLISARGLSPFIGPHIEAEKQLIYERFAKRQGAA